MEAYFVAEAMKYRHTYLKALLVGAPVVTVLLSGALTHNYFSIDCYNWWYTLMYPGVNALLSFSIINKDRKLKNQTILSLPCQTGKVWDAKVGIGLLYSGAAMGVLFLAALIFGNFMSKFLQVSFTIELSVAQQVLGSILLWIASLWQIPFCFLLTQKLGTLPMMLIHVGLVTILGVTASLKPWFYIFPQAIASRLMCTVLKVLPNGLPAVEGQMTFTPELIGWQHVAVGTVSSIFWFLLLWQAGKKLYERQAG